LSRFAPCETCTLAACVPWMFIFDWPVYDMWYRLVLKCNIVATYYVLWPSQQEAVSWSQHFQQHRYLRLRTNVHGDNAGSLQKLVYNKNQ
jgi:hypothetical protein